MKFLIFALLVVPTVYSLTLWPGVSFPSTIWPGFPLQTTTVWPGLPLTSLINDKAINRVVSNDGKTVSVSIDVKKANELNPFPQRFDVEKFFSSSTDVDWNGQPDNHQVRFVEPIIGRVNYLGLHTIGKPLIPNEAITKEWDLYGRTLKSIKINVEKVHQYLKGSYFPLLSPYPFPYPFLSPLTVDEGKEGVVVEVKE